MTKQEFRLITATVPVKEVDIAQFCDGCDRRVPTTNTCLPPLCIESPNDFQAGNAYYGRCSEAVKGGVPGIMTQEGFISFEDMR